MKLPVSSAAFFAYTALPLLPIVSTATPVNENVSKSLRSVPSHPTAPKSNEGVSQVVTLPLLPHRTVVTRRRLESSFDTSWEEDYRHDNDVEITRSRYRRWDRSLSSSSSSGHHQVGALYQGYGTHYVDLWVGTPPQRQTVIVDTGSHVAAFPCSSCHSCGESYHTDRYFQEELSSTFEKMTCSDCWLGDCSRGECWIMVSYQEGSSWSAYEAKDWAYLGGPHSAPLLGTSPADDVAAGGDGADPHSANEFRFEITFGCQTELTGLFKTQLADGIAGMKNDRMSLWSQMYRGGKLGVRNFALCFNRQPITNRDGTDAGAFTLGGVDTRLHNTPNSTVYAKNVAQSGWYTIRVKAVYLREGGGESAISVAPANGGKVVQIDVDEAHLNGHGIIVDSGTTDTYLPSALAGPFKKAWKEMTGSKYTNDAKHISEETLLSMPTVLFQFGGMPENVNADGALVGDLDPANPTDILVAMPATHYMEYSDKSKSYTSRLYMDEDSGGVLGANFMMGHDISFDIDKGRVGFAESSCDYVALAGQEQVSNRR